MSVAVTLNCFVLNKKLYLLFADKDFEDIIENWNKSHEMLNLVRKQNLCHHITKISEIDNNRYKFLIGNSLNFILEKKIEEILKEDDVDIQFLHFLLKGFICKLQIETNFNVEDIKIQRINPEIYNFIVNIGDSIAVTKPLNKKPELKILKGNKE